MIHIFLAAVFNHIFVHLQALLREKYSDMRILLTTHPTYADHGGRRTEILVALNILI